MASTMPPDESGAARACWVKNVMLHFVDGGQSVFHGYPMAYRFFEQADGGWSRWYGNECNGGYLMGQSTTILISLACLTLLLL